MSTQSISAPDIRDSSEESASSDAVSRKRALERAKKTLALYKETTTYPYWSRRADGSTMHLIDWQKTYPVGQVWAADAERREIRADLTMDRLFASPGETLTAILTVTRADDGSPFIPDEVTARVEYFNPEFEEWSKAKDVEWTRQGDQWRAEIQPSSIAPLTAAQRDVNFVASVRRGEAFSKELRMPFRYVAAPSFVVHGLAGDRVVDGSLELTLDVEVIHIGPTLIQAGLFDERGETPIAVYDDYFRPTQRGRQQVAIRFFGRAIRERGIAGPYRVRALHGHVRPPGDVPLELFYSVPDEPPLVTDEYPLTAFSSEEWNSPERSAKIALYEDVIRELEPSQKH
ncbi:MAG: hypothetical protein MJE77_19305 [Proteobacteria bacterium]|nr:hypothetical protein [Pseudomonadota bacterium]